VLFVATPARAGTSQCPSASFLRFEGANYASEPVPAGTQVPSGGAIGSGQVDQPSGSDPCRRKTVNVTVTAIKGVEPAVAVLVLDDSGRRVGFIAGQRCTGEPARWPCILSPLQYGGRRYTAIGYPSSPGPPKTVGLGQSLGPATLGGAAVTAHALDGVDPALAVGADGHPNEVFVAASVCLYERLDNRATYDDLPRCLRAPTWFTFDPLGPDPGTLVTATSDRVAPAALDGATVKLARLTVLANLVPRDRSSAVAVGTIEAVAGSRVKLTFTVPHLAQGVYEAVVRCPRCATAFDGRTVFPAGSLLVFSGSKGSSAPRIIGLVLGGAVLLLAFAAVRMWRRGYKIQRKRRSS
jgi:hypothetical protein